MLAVADSVAFNVAVDDILKHADAEGRRPSLVAAWFLAERVETKCGHTITPRFYGRPKAWMGEFMPTGKLVRPGQPLRHQQQRHPPGAGLRPGRARRRVTDRVGGVVMTKPPSPFGGNSVPHVQGLFWAEGRSAE